MAFHSGTAPGTADDEIGPTQDREFRWTRYALGSIVFWKQQYRTISTYRVYYVIDSTMPIPAVNATWTVGADTYNLRSTSTDMGFLDGHGILECTYFFEGTWTDV